MENHPTFGISSMEEFGAYFKPNSFTSNLHSLRFAQEMVRNSLEKTYPPNGGSNMVINPHGRIPFEQTSLSTLNPSS